MNSDGGMRPSPNVHKTALKLFMLQEIQQCIDNCASGDLFLVIVGEIFAKHLPSKERCLGTSLLSTIIIFSFHFKII